MTLSRRFVIAVLAGLVIAPSASAQITWNVTYSDGNITLGVPATGFADGTISGSTTIGQLRRDSVNAAITYLNTVLDGRGTTNINFNASLTSGTGFLASFGPNQYTGIAGTFQNGGVYQASRTNQRPFSGVDGAGQFNFGYGWNYVGQTPVSTRYDMVTVAIHEIGHALGFLSLTNSAGQGLLGSTLGTPDIYSGWDVYLQRGNGVGGGLFNTTITNSNFGSFTGLVSTLTNGNDPTTGLFFGGTYAREVNSNPLPIFAPATYQSGSSTSHFNDSSAVMNPSVAPNTIKRFKPYEIAVLLDIGWNSYNWNNTTGNWLDGVSVLLNSRWRTNMGIVYSGAANGNLQYNSFANPGEAPVLPPYAQVTSNIVLNFGGSSAYTSTNDIGTVRLARLNLSSSGGGPTITGGTLDFGLNSDGIASVVAPKIVQNGNGPFTIASNIRTNNVASFTTPASEGSVAFPGSTGLTIDGSGSGQVTISGIISGGISSNGGFGGTTVNGSLTKGGTFTLILSGANTYNGGTIVNAGTLTAQGSSALGATTGTLAVNNLNSGPGTNVVLNLSTTADTTTGSLSGSIGTPSSGTNTATINTASGRVFTVNQTVAGTYQGVIAGSGGFTLGSSSTNTLTLTGNNTYSGNTIINAGTLRVNGQTGSNSGTGTGTVTVNGGVLAGTGRAAGAVTANSGGTVAPGSGGPGTLTLGNGVTLNSGAMFSVELNGTTAGTQYDQLNVTGSVTITGSTLSATRGFVPAASDKFYIIVNDGSDAVTGTFNGIAQGGTISIGGTTAYVSYFGDSVGNTVLGGNDVVITFQPIPEPGAVLAFAFGLFGAGTVIRRRQRRRQESTLAV